MGTWAVDAFGNDAACDWTYELVAAKNLAPIETAFSNVLSSSDASDAAEAIAAAEVVARLQGNFGERNGYSKEVDMWVAQSKLRPDAALLATARAVIDRILQPPSELLTAWQESDEFDAWKTALLDIKSRIR